MEKDRAENDIIESEEEECELCCLWLFCPSDTNAPRSYSISHNAIFSTQRFPKKSSIFRTKTRGITDNCSTDFVW